MEDIYRRGPIDKQHPGLLELRWLLRRLRIEPRELRTELATQSWPPNEPEPIPELARDG